MDAMRQDLRFAVRSLRQAPGFAVVAIGCLALGIGISTAAFSILNALVFRPLPGVAQHRQLVDIYTGWTSRFGPEGPAPAAYPDYVAYRDGLTTVQGIAAVARERVVVDLGGAPQPTMGEIVSANYFDMLGTRLALGRGFLTTDETQASAEPSAVVSHAVWIERLDGRANALGSAIRINGRRFTIIGVAPQGFVGRQAGELLDPSRGAPQVWVPLGMATAIRPARTGTMLLQSLDDRWLSIFARLGPRTTRAQVQVDANRVASELARRFPIERRDAFSLVTRLGVSPRGGAAEAVIGVALFMSVPLIVLLVACANVANLLLARGTRRAREIAIRISLGATRRRVVRQLLTESLLIAVAAGMAGVLIALWAKQIATSLGLALPDAIPIDGRVATVAILAVLATTLLFGLVPALRVSAPALLPSLKEGGGAGYQRSRLRGALVVGQVAVSMLLLTLCGLFLRSAAHGRGLDLGMGRDSLAIASVDLDLLRFSEAEGRAYLDAALTRVRNPGGVAGVSAANFGAFESGGEVRAQPFGSPDRALWVREGAVGPAFFHVAGVSIRRGRDIGVGDGRGSPRIGIVNAAMALEMWPDRDPIGQRLSVGSEGDRTVIEIVGLVDDVRMRVDEAPRPTLYRPMAQSSYDPAVSLYVRTKGDAEAAFPAIAAAMTAVDPRMPPPRLTTPSLALRHELHPWTLLATGVGLCGVLALLLAAVGLYAVLAFIVAQRTQELGIRMALGATVGDVVRLVGRDAMGTTLRGIGIGVVLSGLAGTLMHKLLLGVLPVDPIAFGSVAFLLVTVGAVAAIVPARRAASVEPGIALRSE